MIRPIPPKADSLPLGMKSVGEANPMYSVVTFFDTPARRLGRSAEAGSLPSSCLGAELGGPGGRGLWEQQRGGRVAESSVAISSPDPTQVPWL